MVTTPIPTRSCQTDTVSLLLSETGLTALDPGEDRGRNEHHIMDLHERLTLLENRLKRDFDHLLTVRATQRERTDKAFDDVKIAMREQQARTESAFDQVKLAMLEQDLALRGYVKEIGGALGELAVAVKDHEERLRRLEGKPPAA